MHCGFLGLTHDKNNFKKIFQIFTFLRRGEKVHFWLNKHYLATRQSTLIIITFNTIMQFNMAEN